MNTFDDAGDIAKRARVDALFNKLEELTAGGGYASPGERREFRDAVRELRAIGVGPWRGYSGEKLGHAESWAETLFSARKHRRWDISSQTGAQQIRGFIRGDRLVARRNCFAAARIS